MTKSLGHLKHKFRFWDVSHCPKLLQWPKLWDVWNALSYRRDLRRPFLLLRISFPGRPIFIQFIPGFFSSGSSSSTSDWSLDESAFLLFWPLLAFSTWVWGFLLLDIWIGWCFFPSKVALGKLFISPLWTNLAKICYTFNMTARGVMIPFFARIGIRIRYPIPVK